MLFNSGSFFVFLAVVLGIYWAARKHTRNQNAVLLVASYVFYGAWDWRFLFLLAGSTVVDYVVGNLLSGPSSSEKRRKQYLLFSLAANLSVLGVFKYFNFFAGSFEDLLQVFGMSADVATLRLILPIGISFYTFQTLSYTIDVYRRRIPAERNFITYACYVSFFPQLVAGPIERAKNLMPQLNSRRTWSNNAAYEALWLITWGLFKKVVIADNVARLIDEYYLRPGRSLDTVSVIAAATGFAVQIYCDFSGYTDIARGVAKLLGIDLTINFRAPYFARNPQEFWTRWHISLSSWIRDYLYFPLGGGRHGRLRASVNVMITMALGGLWHGAALTFVLWGLFHGMLLVMWRLVAGVSLNRSSSERFDQKTLLPVAFGIIVTFAMVNIGWILFRSPDFEVATWLLSSLLSFTASADGLKSLLIVAVFFSPVLFVDLMNHTEIFKFSMVRQNRIIHGAAFALIVSITAAIAVRESVQFVYFQF